MTDTNTPMDPLAPGVSPAADASTQTFSEPVNGAPADPMPPTDSPTPLPDPQKLVDQALTPAEPTPPTALENPAPVSPKSAPEPVTAEAVNSTAPLSDEMPLAFAAAATPIAADTKSSLPQLETPSAPLPPAGSIPQAPEKPKTKKTGKILSAIVGFFLLVAGIGGGYYYYSHYLVERGTIAVITDKDSCSGCHNGGWLVWRNGQCKVTGICDSGVPGKDTQNPAATPTPEKACTGNISTCCGTGYYYCGGAINKCVSEGALTAAGGGCNKYGEVVYHIPTVYGSGFSAPDANGSCGSKKKCTCGSGTSSIGICFDKTGYCDQADATSQGLSGTNYNQMGLCAVAGGYDSNGTYHYGYKQDANGNWVQVDQYWGSYTCTDSGCTTTNGACTTVGYTCPETYANISCVQNQRTPSTGTTFVGKCGTVEQIDVMCNGQYVQSRTRINPPCAEASKPPETTTPPTFACSGLTKDKATPKIGDKVTFTCAGAATPAGSVTLSYQFRYRKDAGAWTSLTAAANKTTLTVDTAATYDVQCKACGAVPAQAKSTCDPEWTTL